jgi:hypothetical protein
MREGNGDAKGHEHAPGLWGCDCLRRRRRGRQSACPSTPLAAGARVTKVHSGATTVARAEHLRVGQCGAKGDAAQGRPRKLLKLGAASIERNSEGGALPCEVLAEFHLRLMNVTVRSSVVAAAAVMIDRSSCRCRTNADAANACIRCDYGEIAKRCNETSMGDFGRQRNLLLAGVGAEQSCRRSFGGFGHAACRDEELWQNATTGRAEQIARAVCLRTARSRVTCVI